MLNQNTWCDWKQFFRDVCAEYFIQNPVKVGGDGVYVEIDETHMTRRKYQRGALRGNHGQWIFGGVVRGDASKCFMVPVEKRDAKTLLPIIQKFILPGSIVVSDLWKAYWTVGNLPEGYQHLTINHSINFVDPENADIHTQSVENCWMRFKKEHRKRWVANPYLVLETLLHFSNPLFSGTAVPPTCSSNTSVSSSGGRNTRDRTCSTTSGTWSPKSILLSCVRRHQARRALRLNKKRSKEILSRRLKITVSRLTVFTWKVNGEQ